MWELNSKLIESELPGIFNPPRRYTQCIVTAFSDIPPDSRMLILTSTDPILSVSIDVRTPGGNSATGGVLSITRVVFVLIIELPCPGIFIIPTVTNNELVDGYPNGTSKVVLNSDSQRSK